MATKKILGLDLGTNSIGWAVVNENDEKKSISHAGSRIIPMDAALQVILRAEIVSLKQPIELRHVVFVGYLSVVLCAESASIEY